MSPWTKSGLTWLAALCLLALFFVVRYQMVQGRFQSVASVKPAVCRAIASGLPGVQDLAVDNVRGLLLISARNPANPGASDGIYSVKLSDAAARPVRLKGAPPDFHPGGMDLYRGPDGADQLMVIDHKNNGVTMLEGFGLSAAGDMLSPQTTVRSGQLVGPADLAMIGPNAFYLANDHVTKGWLGRFAEDYLLWPHADILAFNGVGFRIAMQRIAAPSGVAARTRFLYATAMNGRKLLAFSREDFTGNLIEIGSLSMPARLDKVSLDPAGNLIVAGQPRPGAAQVYRVSVGADGVPQGIETLFSDDGKLLKGAGSAVVAGGHLFIGSPSDSKILDCTAK